MALLNKKTMKYYTLTNILAKECQYNIIIGERSNGKTYAVLKHGLEEYCKNGSQMAIVRRWDEDYKNKRGASMFDALINNNEISKLTKGEWTGIMYQGMRWYLCKTEDGERIRQDDPFCVGFALAGMEHDKSTAYPKIRTILFDEFMTRGYYLPDEFVTFMNVLSTIIRDRDDVRIFMCGNTVNKYSPYFTEMGLTHIREMKKGDLEVYTYGESGLRVAVEFSDSPSKNKPSDVYFAFDNPKLSMITGKGGIWEIAIYPHCPIKFRPADIQFVYFIEFTDTLLQCEVIQTEQMDFTFIHRKTTPLQHPDQDFIYSTEHNALPNVRRKITKPITKLEKKIVRYYQMDKIFYQDNEVGEIVRNYLMWCKTSE